MATHNVADGSGGLDASIRLEEQRDEVQLLNQLYGISADSVPRMSAMDSAIRSSSSLPSPIAISHVRTQWIDSHSLTKAGHSVRQSSHGCSYCG